MKLLNREDLPNGNTLVDREREAVIWERKARRYRVELDRDPDNASTWMRYGQALEEGGQLIQAQRTYCRALERKPGAADVYLRLGHVLRLQNRDHEARAFFLCAFALDPDVPDALRETGALGWSESEISELRRGTLAQMAAERMPARQARSADEGAADGLELYAVHEDPEIASGPQFADSADMGGGETGSLRDPFYDDERQGQDGNAGATAGNELGAIVEERLGEALAEIRILLGRLAESRRGREARRGASRDEPSEASRPNTDDLDRAQKVLLESGLFDVDWYLREYADIRMAGVNPVEHYLNYGAREGRNPGPMFDTNWYLDNNADVRKAGVNPLLHYCDHGRLESRRSRQAEFMPSRAVDPYQAWLSENVLTDAYRNDLVDALELRAARLPSMAVIMPVFNTPPDLLDRAIESVRSQIRTDWELCIADDCSTNQGTLAILDRWIARDRRIKLIRAAENGNISRATNLAVSLTNRDVISFLDHDDELDPAALAEIAVYYADHPETDIVYSDDDKIDQTGRRFDPQFKPDWSPTLLCSYMYMSHLLTVRRELFVNLGGFRSGFEGSQDFDFALRASEAARHIGHVPKILYHWRVTPGSTAESGDAKPTAFAAGQRAVAEAFRRRGLAAEVVQPPWATLSKLGIFEPQFPHEGPLVSIIMPTGGNLAIIRTCLCSLFEQTRYQNFELIILYNKSTRAEVFAYLATLTRDERVSIVDSEGPFNFAKICNLGAARARGELLLFLNDDIEVLSPGWLSQMVGYLQMRGVGAVGARLLYPDDRIQHGGIIHGLNNGLAGHANKLLPGREFGYLCYAKVAREYSGVTAACLLTRRSLFFETGGFDEAEFAVAYNDVDFCYRLVDAGYRCIYCPTAELVHHEGKSRGFGDNPAEVVAIRKKYGNRKDPWYNPNLSLRSSLFQIHPYRVPSLGRGAAKVLFVSHNYNMEGAPHSLLELIVGLKERQIVDPLVLSPFPGPLEAAFRTRSITAGSVLHPLTDVGPAELYRQRINELKRTLRQSGCEVVVANTCQTFWAVDAAREANLPAIWIIRESEPWGSYFDYVPRDIRSRCYEAFDYAYRVVFVADATLQGWRQLETRHNYTIIPNGLDTRALDSFLRDQPRQRLRQRLDIGEHEIAVLLMGTVCERKRQIDLIRAIAEMPEVAVERACFLIVGDRPSEYSDMLRKEWDNLPAARRQRVVIVPETSHPFDYYGAADVAVCSSRYESYPRVILEAMAFGLPIVTAPVWGIREQTQENVNALYYEVGDTRGLALNLTRIISDHGLRSRLAKNARAVFDSLPGYDDMLRSYGAAVCEARLTR